jgi:hypothetical protein
MKVKNIYTKIIYSAIIYKISINFILDIEGRVIGLAKLIVII